MKTSFQNVLYTGPLGTAMIPKVFSNLLCAVNIIAAAEAMMVAKKAGTVNQNLEFHPEIVEEDLARCFKVGLESKKKASLLLKINKFIFKGTKVIFMSISIFESLNLKKWSFSN